MSLKQLLPQLLNPLADLIQKENQTLPPEKLDILIKRLRNRLYKRMGTLYSGNVKALFKGQGVDLKNIREYQPGDEVRKMDWNALARTSVPYIKEHYEEKQINVWFFLDTTSSMHFGQRQKKISYACSLISLLGVMALDAGHRVGLILWKGEEKPEFIRPKSAETGLQLILKKIEEIISLESSYAQGGNFPHLAPLLQTRSLLFIMSDFNFLIPDSVRILSRLSPKHQLYSLLIVDPTEERLTTGYGWLPLSDMAIKEPLWIDISNTKAIEEYQDLFKLELKHKEEILSLWSRFYKVDSSKDPLDTIIFLAEESRR